MTISCHNITIPHAISVLYFLPPIPSSFSSTLQTCLPPLSASRSLISFFLGAGRAAVDHPLPIQSVGRPCGVQALQLPRQASKTLSSSPSTPLSNQLFKNSPPLQLLTIFPDIDHSVNAINHIIIIPVSDLKSLRSLSLGTKKDFTILR